MFSLSGVQHTQPHNLIHYKRPFSQYKSDLAPAPKRTFLLATLPRPNTSYIIVYAMDLLEAKDMRRESRECPTWTLLSEPAETYIYYVAHACCRLGCSPPSGVHSCVVSNQLARFHQSPDFVGP